MKKITKLFSVMMILSLLFMGTSAITVESYAKDLNVNTDNISEFTFDENSVDNVSAVFEKPICKIYAIDEMDEECEPLDSQCQVYNNQAYNAAVVYKWTAGANATGLSLSATGSIYNTINSTVYKDFSFPNVTGERTCHPSYIYGKSTYSSGSSAAIKIGYEYCPTGGSYCSIIYDYSCRYFMVGKFDKARSTTAKMPTEFDVNKDFLWEHTTGWPNFIKGTIAYNDEISDIEVIVPILGYQTTEVTLDGVTFYLRTGPNKCSLRASEAVSTAGLQFAFGIGR